jgi:hypothetical protein
MIRVLLVVAYLTLLQVTPGDGGVISTELLTPTILYEEALDARGLTELAQLHAERYFVIYQNDADPDAQKSGVINASKVAHYVANSQGDAVKGWGVLDFENPFDSWIQMDPKSERTQSAVKSMVETIRVMKRAFPGVRWTYYGMPGLLYYLSDIDWSKASSEAKDIEIQRQLAAYGPVMAECDWLAPCVYYTVGDGKRGKVPPLEVRAATRAWVAARTAMCVRFAKSLGRKLPVIPFASPLYMDGGGARVFSPIPSAILEEDILGPVAQSGAAGVCIWTGATNFIGIATGARPGDTMMEGGGKSGLVKTWAEDLGVQPADLQGESGRIKLVRWISQAQVAMAKSASRNWKAPPKPTPVVDSPK